MSIRQPKPDRITLIVDGPIAEDNLPHMVLERGGQQEHHRGAGMQGALSDFLDTGEQTEKIASLLLNSRGGLVDVAEPVHGNIQHMEYSGIPTTVFVTDDAQSYGGELLSMCSVRIPTVSTLAMWHQTYYKAENSSSHTDARAKKALPELAYPRHVFRNRLKVWLESSVHASQRGQALRHMHRAFEDPANHLDDVEFFGDELLKLGIAQHAAESVLELALRYRVHVKSKLRQWHPLERKFFGLSANQSYALLP